MERGRFIQRDDPKRLQSARSLDGLDHDVRAFVGTLKTVPPKTGDMKENVRHAVVRHDEAETFRHVEPLDATAHLDKFERLVARKLGHFATAAIDRLRGHRHIK
jgi:hypothetical protein